MVGFIDSKSSHLHFFTSLPIQFAYATGFEQSRSFMQCESKVCTCQSVTTRPLHNTVLILVRLFQVSVSVSLQVLRLSLSFWDSDQATVTQFETQKAWVSDDYLTLCIKWYFDVRFFGHEIPCVSLHYNAVCCSVHYNAAATLAQPWPRGAHTQRK